MSLSVPVSREVAYVRVVGIGIAEFVETVIALGQGCARVVRLAGMDRTGTGVKFNEREKALLLQFAASAEWHVERNKTIHSG